MIVRNSILNKIGFLRSRKRYTKQKVSKRSTESRRGLRSRFLKLIIVTSLLIGLTITGSKIFEFNKYYNSFELRDWGNYGTGSIKEWEENENITILVAGIDSINSEVRFVDALAVIEIEIERPNVNIYVINPDIEIFSYKFREKAVPRTALNKGEDSEFLITAAEELLAMKVDRYIFIDEEGFDHFLASIESIDINLVKVVSDSDITNEYGSEFIWGEGVVEVGKDKILPLIKADSNGVEDKLRIQSEFIEEYIMSVFNLKSIFYARDYLNALSNFSYTNFEKNEVIWISKLLMSLKKDDINIIYTRDEYQTLLEKRGVYDVYGINYTKLDNDIQLDKKYRGIALEQAKIEILNSTDIPGFAKSNSRWYENQGLRVVNVGNSPERTNDIRVYVKNIEQFPKTINIIKRIFADDVEIIEEDFPFNHQGDIVIILGNDFFK